MRRSIAGAGLGLLLAAGTAAAQTFATDNPVLRRIWTIGMDSSQTYQLSQALFDSIGPRLTGSPGVQGGQRLADREVPVVGHPGARRAVRHLARLAPRRRPTSTWWRRGCGRSTARCSPGAPAPAARRCAASWSSSPTSPTAPRSGPGCPVPAASSSRSRYPEPSCRPDSEWITTALPDSWKRFQETRAAASARPGRRGCVTRRATRACSRSRSTAPASPASSSPRGAAAGARTGSSAPRRSTRPVVDLELRGLRPRRAPGAEPPGAGHPARGRVAGAGRGPGVQHGRGDPAAPSCPTST